MSNLMFDPYLLVQNAYPNSVAAPGATTTATVAASTVAAGQVMFLRHAADNGANLAAFSSPNNVGNSWQLINSIDYGSGGPKLRVWWKTATAADEAASTTYSVTGPSSTYHSLVTWSIPAGYIDPNTAPTSTTSSGFGDTFTHPALATPNYITHERNLGMALGFVASSARSANGWKPAYLYGVTGDVWSGAYSFNLDSGNVNGLGTNWEFSAPQLGGQAIPAHGSQYLAPGTAQGVTYGTAPWVSMTILLYPFTGYQTSSTPVSAEVDTFSGSVVDTTKATVASGTPTVNSSHQLVLRGGDSVVYNTVRNLKNSQVVIQVPQLTAGAGQIQLQMGSQTWPNYSRIWVISLVDTTSGSTTNGQTITTLGVTDNGSFAAYSGGAYDSVNTLWWRIREMNGCLFFDASPDGITWRSRADIPDGHGLLDDQLADMTVTLRVTGDPSLNSATFDNLNNPPGPPATAPVPSQRTYDWMGVTTDLKLPYHGRDVLMGIADEGSTTAARAFNNVTMVSRKYMTTAGAPQIYQAGVGYVTGEIFPGENHGCWVLSDGVPPGGKYVEAVISDASGGASASTMCSGLLWCAQQGAQVINLSFGGPSDDPTYVSTFDFIAANYSCLIFIAAGNDYAATLQFPARYSQNYSWIFSVGAFDELTGLRAPFSDYYNTLTGVAPGAAVNGLLPDGTLSTWSGTSAASPHSANIAARLLTAAVNAPAAVGQAMKATARPTAAPQVEQGNGAFDLSRATAVLAAPPIALAGIAVLNLGMTSGTTRTVRAQSSIVAGRLAVTTESTGGRAYVIIPVPVTATAIGGRKDAIGTAIQFVDSVTGTTARSHDGAAGPVAVQVINVRASAQVGSLWSTLPREQQYDIRGATVRYIAQQIYSREIIHWDLPLTGAQVDWALSTPCSIAGNLDPDHPDLTDLALEPWATAIHMEIDGIIRASGILMPFSVNGETLSVQAIGPSTYIHGTVYLGAFQQMDPTIMTVLRELWNHAQMFDNSKDLGVQLPAGELPFTISGGAMVDQNGNVVQKLPYTMAWYDLKDCGDTWDNFAKMLPFDYQEATWWNDAHTDVTNGINIGYPRLGTNRYELKFATEENILAAVPIAEVDSMYASSIFAKGSGEGSAMQFGYTNYWIDRRLRRVTVIDESSEANATVLNGIAYDETVRRLNGLIGIDQIVTDATHPNAPLGSYLPGDDITVEVSSPWGASRVGLHRVMGISYNEDADTATLKLRPSGSFRYGAQDGTGQ